MGIRFSCPNGHHIHVKAFLAGRRGICPHCGIRFRVPMESGGVAQAVVKGEGRHAHQPGVAAGHRSEDVAAGIVGEWDAIEEYDAEVLDAETDEPEAVPYGSGAGGAPTMSAPAWAAQPTGAAAVPIADPLAEAPGAMWYVRPHSGGQFGPAAADMMSQWISENRVAADSLVWRDGWPDWRAAAEVFPQFRAAFAQGAPLLMPQFSGPLPLPGGAMPGTPMPGVGMPGVGMAGPAMPGPVVTGPMVGGPMMGGPVIGGPVVGGPVVGGPVVGNPIVGGALPVGAPVGIGAPAAPVSPLAEALATTPDYSRNPKQAPRMSSRRKTNDMMAFVVIGLAIMAVALVILLIYTLNR